MPAERGRSGVRRYMGALPRQFTNLLRGAGKAGATIIADEAKDRTQSAAVRDAVQIEVRAKDGIVTSKIVTKGPGAHLAPWEEYGTSPHFISVAANQRQGRTIGRINRLRKEGKDGVLVINGKFVGDTVFHPGAQAHPFLRPALDLKIGEAIAAGQSFIRAHVTKNGITVSDRAGDAG